MTAKAKPHQHSTCFLCNIHKLVFPSFPLLGLRKRENAWQRSMTTRFTIAHLWSSLRCKTFPLNAFTWWAQICNQESWGGYDGSAQFSVSFLLSFHFSYTDCTFNPLSSFTLNILIASKVFKKQVRKFEHNVRIMIWKFRLMRFLKPLSMQRKEKYTAPLRIRWFIPGNLSLHLKLSNQELWRSGKLSFCLRKCEKFEKYHLS